jgi:hypothetical protein
VFGNRMPSIIFGPGKEEVMGGRRKLHSEKPHNFSLRQISLQVSNQEDGLAGEL